MCIASKPKTQTINTNIDGINPAVSAATAGAVIINANITGTERWIRALTDAVNKIGITSAMIRIIDAHASFIATSYGK